MFAVQSALVSFGLEQSAFVLFAVNADTNPLNEFGASVAMLLYKYTENTVNSNY